jgi:hypothetical protein
MRTSSSLKVISEIGKTRNDSSSSNSRKYKKTKVLNTREKKKLNVIQQFLN